MFSKCCLYKIFCVKYLFKYKTDLNPDKMYLFSLSFPKVGTDTPPQALSRSLPGGKNPVSVLMEHSQRSGHAIQFIKTGQEGPPHDPR